MNVVCAMLAFLFAYSVLEPANVHIQLEPVTCCALDCRAILRTT